MNERIKELMIQAEDPEHGFIIPEKFAELIVWECVKAADEWYQYHNEIQWDPGEHIKQRFGVKE